MPLDFTAIDFETANNHSASACSVGLVRVRGGEIVERAGWLIKPPVGYDVFSEWNTRIHGITAADVSSAAGWLDQLPLLLDFIGDDTVVAHNAGFDMKVLGAACSAVGAEVPLLRYACSLQLARKTYHLDSYRLPVVAMAAGFEDFSHHDALEDALACASIVVHAAARHGAESMETLAELAGLRLSQLMVATAA
ncbi:3'-5' exonuclease [Ruicaihuangia caeni]|uniref:3'-5' exonuclease n=1 Tax=Ruicaihuangia caeni TaxID=3042517 RepID=A0AAW6TAN4_9MICO|nr:3'-5' exonuclease [Klugiella sp. YN-L-19]MDI2099484.1 3'-5' exonuclease [Klugiella sp. YN-L-19]